MMRYFCNLFEMYELCDLCPYRDLKAKAKGFSGIGPTDKSNPRYLIFVPLVVVLSL